jgi:hypothetical protein
MIATFTEEFYKDIRSICGVDPVVEMFNLLVQECKFYDTPLPETFVRHIRFRIDEKFRKEELEKVYAGDGRIDPQYTGDHVDWKRYEEALNRA